MVAESPCTDAPDTVMVGASVELFAPATSHVSFVVVSPPSLLKLILLLLEVWPIFSQFTTEPLPAAATVPLFNKNEETLVGRAVFAGAVNNVPRDA